MREFTIDDWLDLEGELRDFMRLYPDASREEQERFAEIAEYHVISRQECDARETVQLGRMSATDLKCVKQRAGHGSVHCVRRSFGVVRMTAEWNGEFVE